MRSALDSLASPRRREILRLVWSQERAAGDIHSALGDVTFGAVSQQLQLLTAGGLVAVRDEGRNRLYRARREELGPVAEALESLWTDALYRLTLKAELEESRRGPHPRALRQRARPKRKGRP